MGPWGKSLSSWPRAHCPGPRPMNTWTMGPRAVVPYGPGPTRPEAHWPMGPMGPWGPSLRTTSTCPEVAPIVCGFQQTCAGFCAWASGGLAGLSNMYGVLRLGIWRVWNRWTGLGWFGSVWTGLDGSVWCVLFFCRFDRFRAVVSSIHPRPSRKKTKDPLVPKCQGLSTPLSTPGALYPLLYPLRMLYPLLHPFLHPN